MADNWSAGFVLLFLLSFVAESVLFLSNFFIAVFSFFDFLAIYVTVCTSFIFLRAFSVSPSLCIISEWLSVSS